MNAPDLPTSRNPFTPEHLARWPMGATNVSLADGDLVWEGGFDERDALAARRAFPGRRVRITDAGALVVGRVDDEPQVNREWVDDDGVEWRQIGRMTVSRRPGERNWTMTPFTPEQRRDLHESVDAYNTEDWAEIVGEYEAEPTDPVRAWRYLTHHPIFWSWSIASDLRDVDPTTIDEVMWASIEADGHRHDDIGLDRMWVWVRRDDSGQLTVCVDHGPTLWPLDTPAEHRTGYRVEGTPSHDPDLDVTAPSWEDALIALAERVRARYGDDRSRIGAPIAIE